MASEFLLVAENLIKREKKPLSPKEIVDIAFEEKLFTDNISGKTPHQTMKSKLSVHIRRTGKDSVFIRTKPGKYYLRSLINDSNNKYQIYDAKPFRPQKLEERVVVIPNKWIDDQNLRFQGVKKSWKKFTNKLFNERILSFQDRNKAETNNDFKQIVTYIIVEHAGKLLSFKRGSFTHVASFLRGSKCIGFGGHVTEKDFNLFGTEEKFIIENAKRELQEELAFQNFKNVEEFISDQLEIIGILNDDTSKVGVRHIAYILRLRIDNLNGKKIEKGEKSVTQLQWIDPNKPDFTLIDYEYWSQLCLSKYYPRAEIVKPTIRVNKKRKFEKPHLLCVIGPIGSGKTEATKVLKSNFNYSEINSGQILANILNIPPVPKTNREIFQEKAWKFISKKDGPRLLAENIYNKALGLKNNKVVIDGIRQKETLLELKKMSNEIEVITMYIHTPPHLAYELFNNRKRIEHEFSHFIKIRSNNVEKDVEGLIRYSDIVLYNWKGRDSYAKVIQKFFKGFK